MSVNIRPEFNAGKYDDNILKILPYYKEFYEQVVDVVANYITGSISWLDVGCGTGKMAASAFEKFDNIEKFCFTDCSEDMLNIARKRFSSNNTEFTKSDACSLNYTNEFNVVSAIQCNHYMHIKERKKALSNYFKALKSGGIYISFENTAPATEKGRDLYLKRWKNFQLKKGRNEEECTAHIARYNTVYFPITIEEQLNLMRQAGFKETELLWYSNMQAGVIGIKE